MKSLTEAEQNKIYLINEIVGGSFFKKKIEFMGIRPNVEIKKISNITENGPVIIQILSANCQIAIGNKMAKKIFVTEKNS